MVITWSNCKSSRGQAVQRDAAHEAMRRDVLLEGGMLPAD